MTVVLTIARWNKTFALPSQCACTASEKLSVEHLIDAVSYAAERRARRLQPLHNSTKAGGGRVFSPHWLMTKGALPPSRSAVLRTAAATTPQGTHARPLCWSAHRALQHSPQRVAPLALRSRFGEWLACSAVCEPLSTCGRWGCAWLDGEGCVRAGGAVSTKLASIARAHPASHVGAVADGDYANDAVMKALPETVDFVGRARRTSHRCRRIRC